MNAVLSRPALLYREKCTRCRILSLMIWVITLGAVRRQPLNQGRADQLITRLHSKLVLDHHGVLFTKWRAAGLAILWLLPRWVILALLFGLIQ